MKKSYCTRNNGNCITCNLVNYGMDCRNNPIEGMAPIPQLSGHKGTKESRAMAAYDGFKGGQTVQHIKKLIGKELACRLTGHELGLVMSAVNRAWQEAKGEAIKELEDFIGLPSDVSLWAVIGDKDYLGCKEFPDNLNIPDVLQRRGNLVAQWEAEYEAEKREKAAK